MDTHTSISASTGTTSSANPNMKVLIVLCAVVAVSMAGYLPGGIAGLAAPGVIAARGVVAGPLAYGYAGPQNLPVISPAGVPVDTPAVQIARANHAVAHANAGALALAAGPGLIGAGGLVDGRLAYGYAGPQALPVITPAGVPVDTPAVQIARANHAVAHANAGARALAAGPGLIGAGGVVASRLAYGYAGPQHLPVITPAGVPVDTPAVQVARANHAVAHANAGALALAAGPGVIAGPGVVAARGVLAGSLAYGAAPLAYGYAGPQHIPVITPSGVPVDTPAVQAARAADAVAHVHAKAATLG